MSGTTAQCIVQGFSCGRQRVISTLSESTAFPAARYPTHYRVHPLLTTCVRATRGRLFIPPPALAPPHPDCRLRCKLEGPSLPRKIACRRQLGSREVHSTSAARSHALAVSAELRDGLHRLGIQKLTEMQRVSLLKTLRGSSLVVAAKPGAGKTLAYLLPVLQQLAIEGASQEMASESDDACVARPLALILVPSRELAKQVMEVATALLPGAPLLLLDSTAPLQQQQQMLACSPQLLVATPSRVLALLRRKTRPTAAHAAAAASRGGPVQPELCLEKLRFLVVDEADALLRQDYMSKVSAIYQAARGKKQVTRQASDLDKQEPQRKRQSLQVLLFTAILTTNLKSLIDASFPDVEALDFAVSAHRGQGFTGTCLPRPDEHNQTENSKNKRLSHAEHNSATVGAGVEQHICYVAAPEAFSISSDAKAKASSDDLQQTGDPALRKLRTRRSKLLDKEAHTDGERKMLALAEILRTYITPRTYEGRQPFDQPFNQDEFEAAGCPTDDAKCGPSSSSSSSSSSDSHSSGNVAGSLNAGGQAETGYPTKTKTAPQCVIFADSHAEARFRLPNDRVKYIAHHPLLDGWTLTFVHSGMETAERQRAMQAFVEGSVSVLVCTDVAARGLDIPAVVLVVHMHPPTPASNYIHRFAKFRVHLSSADMLNVPSARYAPLLDLARRLHAKVGVHALATTLLKLGGTASLSLSASSNPDCQSVLTGRRGFAPLLLYDPTHQRLESSMDARRFLLSLLPCGASSEGVGRVVKSANGFVADVSITYADHVIQGAAHKEKAFDETPDNQEIHDGSNIGASRSWVPIFPLERLPRLLNQGMGRRKRAARVPWSKMRQVISFMKIIKCSRMHRSMTVAP
ncbi:hypothetical protein Emed_002979 [Eimeria media]